MERTKNALAKYIGMHVPTEDAKHMAELLENLVDKKLWEQENRLQKEWRKDLDRKADTSEVKSQIAYSWLKALVTLSAILAVVAISMAVAAAMR